MSFNLAERLANHQTKNLYRSRSLVESPQNPSIKVNGKNYLAFSSNDYLGLANHPEVVAALQQGAKDWGVGGGASHLVLGHSEPHQQLELALAKFTGRERALVFSSGYLANLAVITALVGKGDTLLHDRLNHASLLDAGILSGVRFSRYLHKNMASLAKRLHSSQERSAQGNTLIVTDGVFSMDGDLAPLPELAALAQANSSWLMVDDAHGFGVLGNTGGGLVEHYALSQADVPVLVGTLGKAFGTAGAFVAGSEELIETLIQFARPYIYTTSSPPAIACATLASLKILEEEHWRREHLQVLIQQFREGSQALGLKLTNSPTPIQPIIIGDSAETMATANKLSEKGILVGAIRPPTVPQGRARLRITLTAAHSHAQVEALLEALAKCGLKTCDNEGCDE
ncbi:8-amino-7-oxononanoate synthase [Marinospirillum insulare]|uniref:8-amino-7-oxononanoate synthase n=1 Tax=Marinospirillum insulare TaxID=217169 RepID=A0ABQ5ZXS3_9GAMM|nr:8-amino-7-oxononanoate synthase [Marinospirillum insulare]GLR64990.1 8-amino-7-oxononanoate synthase [Marinospirillum insulare]